MVLVESEHPRVRSTGDEGIDDIRRWDTRIRIEVLQQMENLVAGEPSRTMPTMSF